MKTDANTFIISRVAKCPSHSQACEFALLVIKLLHTGNNGTFMLNNLTAVIKTIQHNDVGCDNQLIVM